MGGRRVRSLAFVVLSCLVAYRVSAVVDQQHLAASVASHVPSAFAAIGRPELAGDLSCSCPSAYSCMALAFPQRLAPDVPAVVVEFVEYRQTAVAVVVRSVVAAAVEPAQPIADEHRRIGEVAGPAEAAAAVAVGQRASFDLVVVTVHAALVMLVLEGRPEFAGCAEFVETHTPGFLLLELPLS